MLPIDLDARAELRSWVASRADGIEPDPALDRVALFDQRVLSSLHLPELILLIERLRNEPVDVTTMAAPDVASIDAIVATFFDRGTGR